MQKTVKNRLLKIIFVTLSVSCGVAMILKAMSGSIVFFYSPSELHKADSAKDIRVGGLVKKGSIVKIDSATIVFDITDNKADLKIRYKGIVPMLFRENQGIVALGKIHNNLFIATELLTKHDENYNPPTKQ